MARQKSIIMEKDQELTNTLGSSDKREILDMVNQNTIVD